MSRRLRNVRVRSALCFAGFGAASILAVVIADGMLVKLDSNNFVTLAIFHTCALIGFSPIG